MEIPHPPETVRDTIVFLFAIRPSRMTGMIAAALAAAVPAAAMLPSAVYAQSPVPSRGNGASPGSMGYAYLRGSDTIATEQASVSAESWSGDLAMKGQPRVVWKHQIVRNLPTTFTLEAFAPGTAADAKPLQTATIVMKGDTAHVDMSSGTNTQKQAIGTKPGAVVMLNTSLVHTILIANNALTKGGSDFNVVLVMGGQTLGGKVARDGDSLHLVLEGIDMYGRVDAQGVPVSMSVPSQGLRVVRAEPVARGATPADVRISYDAPADAPYIAEHVRIPAGKDFSLAGTLTRPKNAQRVAVAITISGSGPQDRDSRIASVPGYAPFREIADTLARRGIATLRFDDRAVGESGGIETAAVVTTADFADDVLSIVAWLRRRPDIDSTGIMLIGHSEGGMIAPMVAAADTGIRAIALLAGPAYDGKRILMFQNRQAIDALAIPQATKDSIMTSIPARLDSLGRTSNWIGFFMHHDPLPVIRNVRQPVLIVQGETDRQVTQEQADTLAIALRAAGNSNVTLRKFPATNHLLLEDSSGAPAGYANLKSTRVRRDVLGAIADWVVLQSAK